MKILKSLDLKETMSFTVKFQKPEFKPMIKNLQDKLRKGNLTH